MKIDMRNEQYASLAVVFLLIALLVPTLAMAQKPWREATRGYWKEYPNAKTLPPMCGMSPNPKYKNINWEKLYGPDITWINHYCESKTKMYICYKYPRKEKNACLRSMAKGIEYSFNHAKDPNYRLLPLLYTEYGSIQTELGAYKKAINYLRLSIKKNKRYMLAYAKLSDVLTKLKQYDEAEAILKQGLKVKNSKLLRKRLKKLKLLKK